MLSKNFYKLLPQQQIFVLAHELEHHRQYKKYVGSYHNIYRSHQIEHGADAAATGYIQCPKCLEKIKNCATDATPYENEYGCFSTPKGYFSKQDVDLYLQRAIQENNPLCQAHQKIEQGIAENEIPLKDYLPKQR